MSDRALVLVLAVMAASACGGPGATAAVDGATPDAPIVGYPAGPYGNRPGETLDNFPASGYRLSRQQQDATQLPWEDTIELGDFHRDPACTCLLITVGANWCGACMSEQPLLVEAVTRHPGLCVLDVLQEGSRKGTAATRADVDEWTQRYQQNYPIIQGNSFSGLLTHGAGGPIGLPFGLVVRPSTMRVLETTQGFSSGQFDEILTFACAR